LAHFISRELYFLFAPFIALAIFKAKVNISIVLYGVKVGLIVLAALVYLNTGTFDVRYSGSMNETAYGNIIGAMLLISLARISKENLIEKFFTFFALCLGSLALIASGTRGAWIGTILTMFVYIWIYYKRGELKSFLRFIGLFASAIIISMNFVELSSVENRVSQAKQQAENWLSNNKDVNSSVGERLDMWNASLQQVNTHLPLTGFGYRNITPIIAKQAEKQMQLQFSQYNHVHNTYLNHLLSEGVFGLIAILALLLVPLKIFVANVKSKKTNEPIVASIGVVLMVSFSLFGVTNNLFGDIFINAFYILFLAILLPLVSHNSIKKIHHEI
jgi:O-antigen ligase